MSESKDAVQLLEADHKKVKGLFEKFEKTEKASERKEIVGACLEELKAHAMVEEDIFYPAVKKAIDDDEDLMEEAAEEHHVAKALIAELEEMKGSEDNFAAKFIVLAENVRHHIKEEEGEMFPKLKKTDLDLDALGEKMALRKDILMTGGVPVAAESKGAQRAKKSR